MLIKTDKIRERRYPCKKGPITRRDRMECDADFHMWEPRIIETSEFYIGGDYNKALKSKRLDGFFDYIENTEIKCH